MCHKTNIEYIEKNMIYMSTIGLKINYEMILNIYSKTWAKRKYIKV